MKKITLANLLACLVLLAGNFALATECATNEAGLAGDLRNFSTLDEWYETTMSDRKPMRISITATEDNLHLSFEKSEQQVDTSPTQFAQRASRAEYVDWGSGPVRICRNGNFYEVELLEGFTTTQNMNIFVRGMFRAGQKLYLVLDVAAGVLRTITLRRYSPESNQNGWTATMVPLR